MAAARESAVLTPCGAGSGRPRRPLGDAGRRSRRSP